MPDRVGQQLGNYRLTRLLGLGGYADVYLGVHIHLETQVAIKVLRTELESKYIERFRSEARTLANLNHSRIVRLLDFGIENNLPYLIMDYAPNGSLRQQYPPGTVLPLEKIVSIVKQIAEALQFAHNKKLIHRDIKPENMLLNENNEVVLGDFGIAILSRTSQTQKTQDVKGTVMYMAPEQLQGHPSRASDQYSLGIVIYEWLSGSAPFQGSFAEIMSQHLSVPPTPLSQRVPIFFPSVEQVVMKALEKEPSKRFGSVQEFAEALATAFEEASRLANAPRPLSRLPAPKSLVSMQENTPQNIKSVPQMSKEQCLDEGDFNYEAGRYRKAVAAYYRASILDPDDATIYNKRGNAYRSLKEYEQAIANYNHAIKIDPAFADAYCNRGKTYFDLEEYEKAIVDYDHALTLDPENANFHNNRGAAYYHLDEYEQAIADVDRALALNPKNAIFTLNRGYIYLNLDEYEQAIDDFDRAITLDPEYANAYRNRGLAYYYLKSYQQAAQDFDRALRLDPSITWFQAEREDAYRKLGWKL